MECEWYVHANFFQKRMAAPIHPPGSDDLSIVYAEGPLPRTLDVNAGTPVRHLRPTVE
jgi:hypothetical protein